MVERVIDLVGVLAQSLKQLFEGPYRLSLRVNRLAHLADTSGDLGVALQIVNALRVGRSEQALANRSEAWLGGGSDFLDGLLPGQ